MPTALQLGKSAWASYRPDSERRHGTPCYSQEELTDLRCRIKQAASEIKTRLGAQRVILFGSLAKGGWFDKDSDIDVAVEGLSGAQYLEAWRILELAIPERTTEVIEMETASVGLKKAIETEGLFV